MPGIACGPGKPENITVGTEHKAAGQFQMSGTMDQYSWGLRKKGHEKVCIWDWKWKQVQALGNQKEKVRSGHDKSGVEVFSLCGDLLGVAGAESL